MTSLHNKQGIPSEPPILYAHKGHQVNELITYYNSLSYIHRDRLVRFGRQLFEEQVYYRQKQAHRMDNHLDNWGEP